MSPINAMWRRGRSAGGASTLVALVLFAGCGALAASPLFAAEKKPSRTAKPEPPAPPEASGAPEIPEPPDPDAPLPPPAAQEVGRRQEQSALRPRGGGHQRG